MRSGNYLGCCLALAALAGCDLGAEDPDPRWDQFKASSTRVVDGAELYVIEWDLRVSLDELRSYYEAQIAGSEVGTSFQESIVNTVGGADDVWASDRQLALTYCVSDSFGTAKARAVSELSQAAQAWEAQANVDFIYQPAHDANCNNGNTNVVFSVRPWTSGGACAFFPSGGGCVSRTLVINFNDLDTNPFYDSNAPNVTTVGVFRHELGHILGLRHEHTRPEGACFEDNNWRSLSPYDAGSVMHYPWCDGVTTSDLSITGHDGRGVRALYGTRAFSVADLGGEVINSDPAVIRDGATRRLFYRGPNDHLWMSYHSGGLWWSAPIDLGGVALTSAPSAVTIGPDQYRVFYRGPNHHLWMSSYDGGPWWSAPADLGGVALASEPSAIHLGGGKIDVFYRGPNDHLWMSSYDGGPWWSAPADLGGVALTSAPSAVTLADQPTFKRVFYRGPNGHLWMSSHDGGPWWSAPADLGGVVLGGGPGAVSTVAGTIDVFYSDTSGQLRRSSWDGGPWWSAAYQEGAAVPAKPAPLAWNELYYRGANGHLWVAQR